MCFRDLVLLVAVSLLASACSTTGSEPTRLTVTPEARRAVESEQRALELEAEGREPEQVAALTAKDPNEVICRSEPPPSGTRLGKRRICATRVEWDEMARSAREETELLQQGGRTCAPTPSRPC